MKTLKLSILILLFFNTILYSQNYTSTINVGEWGQCQDDFLDCESTNLQPNTIMLGVHSDGFDGDSIKLAIAKCDASLFQNSGTVYMREYQNSGHCIEDSSNTGQTFEVSEGTLGEIYDFDLTNLIDVGETNLFYFIFVSPDNPSFVSYSNAIAISNWGETNNNDDFSITNFGVLSETDGDSEHLNSITVNRGDEINIETRQYYDGDRTSSEIGGVYCGYYLSEDGNLEPDEDILIGSDYSSIGSDDIYDIENINYTIPNDIAYGTYYIFIKADYLNDFEENNENNNRERLTLIIEEDIDEQEDEIYLTEISLSDSEIRIQQRLSMSCNVNYSGVKTRGELDDPTTAFVLSENTTYESDIDILLYSDAFNVGSDRPIYDESSVVFVPEGIEYNKDYYILFIADFENVISESDETNNIQYLPVRILKQNCWYQDCNDEGCGEFGEITRDAIDYFCGEGIIDDAELVNPTENIQRQDLAKVIFKTLYGVDKTPEDYIASQFPSPYPDLQVFDKMDEYYNYARILCYLEYDDYTTVFDRDFVLFEPTYSIQKAYVIKAYLEAWNITPDVSGTSPFADIDETAEEWGYINKAYQLGLITGFTNNENEFVSGAFDIATREIAFLMLHRLVQSTTISKPTQDDLNNLYNYFIPFNFTPETGSFSQSVAQGNFSYSENSNFNIPDIKSALSFSTYYNSFTTQIPDSFQPVLPMGKGWSHNYNHYIVKESDTYNNIDYYSINYPDGSMVMYQDDLTNDTNDKYLSLGVYDTFEIDGDGITITTKNKNVLSYKNLTSSEHDIFYLQSVTDRNNNAIQIAWGHFNDNVYRVSTVTAPSGVSLEMTYLSGMLIKVKDFNGREISFSYDDTNRLETYTNARVKTTNYKYKSEEKQAEMYLLSEVERPKGNKISVGYDDQNKLSQYSVNGENTVAVTTSNFNISDDENYQQNTVVTPNPDGSNTTTTISYNKNGLVQSSSNNLGTVTHEFPTSGLHIEKPSNSNFNGIDFTYEYDEEGNITKITNTQQSIIQEFDWNDDNTLNWYKDARLNTTSFTYDSSGKGNLEKIRTPLGFETSFTYNDKGQLETITNPEGITKTLSYFGTHGQLLSSSLPEGITQSYTYDSNRRLNGASIGEVSSSMDYDNNNNVINSENALGFITTYNYDDNDNVSSMINPKEVTSNFTFNDKDQLTDFNFGGYNKHYEFNEDDGSLDYYQKPSGQKIQYTYNSDGLLTSTETISTITYDDKNNIEYLEDDYGKISFDYDNINRLEKVTNEVTNQEVEYVYDANSNVTTIKYPNSDIEVEYVYDDDNRLTDVKTRNTYGGDDFIQVSYTYRDDNLLDTITYGNGTYVTRDYDYAGRLISIIHYTSDDEIFAQYGYDYDERGNITKQTFNHPENIHDYPTLEEAEDDYSYNNVNHIQSGNGLSHEIDDDGRATSKGDTNYTFNLDDKLEAVQSVDFTATYQYDALGFKRQAIRKGITSTYEWNTMGMGNILTETTGSKEYAYIHGADGLIARIDVINETIHYYHGDVRGSTIAMTNASEEITHSYLYHDFGGLAQVIEPNNDDNRFRYVGKYGVVYETIDLQHMRARHYDPSIGRFLSEDPVWHENLYAYCGNNPISNIDFNGEESISLNDFYREFNSSAISGLDSFLYGFTTIPNLLINSSGILYESISFYLRNKNDLTKKLFDNYWYNKGVYELSESDFQGVISVLSPNISDYDLDSIILSNGEPGYVSGINFYGTEYDLAIGTGDVFFDNNLVPIGFGDDYDFNFKLFDKETDRSFKSEIMTLGVRYMSSYFSGSFYYYYGIRE